MCLHTHTLVHMYMSVGMYLFCVYTHGHVYTHSMVKHTIEL